MELVARKLHIGKHASFHAEVTIHDLLNVPLVTGKFSCKWRFKNHISPQSALTGEGAASSSLLHPRSALHISRRAGNSDSSSSSDEESAPGRQSTDSRRTSMSSQSPSSPVLRSDLIPPGRSMSANTARPTSSESHRSGKPEAHGVTEAVPLSKHTANWEDRQIFCPVSAPVGKDGELGHCPLKLVIRQTFHTEQGKVEDARLGDVHVNLSEFADPTRNATRRFLLNNSKINALLRITVRLQHVGGVKDFHACVPGARVADRPLITRSCSPPQQRGSKMHGKDKDSFKKKNASSESCAVLRFPYVSPLSTDHPVNSSSKGRQGSKGSSRDKESPTSSVHSKRSGGSGPNPPLSNGSNHRSLPSSSLALASLGAPPGSHRQHGSHHAPEAIIEHLFSLSLDDMPVPDDAPSNKASLTLDHTLPDEPSSPQSVAKRPETAKSGSTSSKHSHTHTLFHTHHHHHAGQQSGEHAVSRPGEATPA